jgi:hypothetical protein
MKNMSNVERIVRIVIGAVILIWGIAVRSWWGAIGLIPLITGLIGFCALYKVMGTCCPFTKKNESQSGGCCAKKDKPSGGCCGH